MWDSGNLLCESMGQRVRQMLVTIRRSRRGSWRRRLTKLALKLSKLAEQRDERESLKEIGGNKGGV